MNAAAAGGAAAEVGIPATQADASLAQFAGTWRRFEYKGTLNGALVYDDYGHHPTEIEATIRGAREMYSDKKLTLIFQSHTYSRTHVLFDDFTRVLALADRTIILPVYAAREENTSGVSHTKLAEAVSAHGGYAEARETFDDVVGELKTSATAHDLILVMGAGDITQVATKLVS
jgi:UDP-N-acetylmuramate--alanine ligase